MRIEAATDIGLFSLQPNKVVLRHLLVEQALGLGAFAYAHGQLHGFRENRGERYRGGALVEEGRVLELLA